MTDATLERPGFDHVLWTRVGLVLCLGAALVFAIGALLSQPQIVRIRSFNGMGAVKARVESMADQLAGAWHPSDRAALLDRWQGRSDLGRYRSALRAALREQRGAAQRRLIECAAVVGGAEVRREVANIAIGGGGGGGGAQVAAIGVAHKLRPWSRAELGDFLNNHDRNVRIGTLEAVAQGGGELPEEALLACLVADDPAERAAAVRAIPSRPSAALLSQLESMLEHGDSRHAAQAIAALSVCACADDYEDRVTDCLASHSDEVKLAALAFLRERGRAPARPQCVWALVADTMQSPRLRAAALHCLERAGGVDLEALRALAPSMSPAERLLAARCLIRAGDAVSVTVLTGLLLDDSAPQVVESSRRHLAWLTGAAPSSSAEQFRAAFVARGEHVRRSHLPPLGFEVE